MNDEPVASIYRIVNKHNGWVYVGITTRSLKERLSGHKSTLFTFSGTPFENKSKMHDDCVKYGRDCLEIELVEYVWDLKDADEVESFWIQKAMEKGNCYNVSRKANP